jgi:hypothetical protein
LLTTEVTECTAAGHVRIAGALVRVLDPMLREEVIARRALAQ